jgi:antirestriction protein
MSTVKNKYGSIYVGTYEKYNNGSIAGKWLNLGDYDNIDGFYKACKDLHGDEVDPELMFQDWEYIPERFISESFIDFKYWDYMDHIENSHLDFETFEAGMSLGIPYGHIESFYYGQYDTDQDFTIEYFENTQGELNNKWPYNCIDWDQASRQLMEDFNAFDGYYFSNFN